MRSFVKKSAALLLGVVMMTSFGEALPVYGQSSVISAAAVGTEKQTGENFYTGIPDRVGFFACGVPIPESAPGEEKKDIAAALIGLSVITAVVIGGLLLLQKKNTDTTK